MRRSVLALVATASFVGCRSVPSVELAPFDRRPHVRVADPDDFRSRGCNPRFVLVPGSVLVLAGPDDDGEHVELTITVLDETRDVGGVETRVVEEREVREGALARVVRKLYAISERTKDVYLFGEEVDEYLRGRVVGHLGAWKHGENGAEYALVVPSRATGGRTYSRATGRHGPIDWIDVTSDRVRTVVPAGHFEQCMDVFEHAPRDAEHTCRAFQRYAPGVGLVRRSDLELVRYVALPTTGG